ncbi:MAG TPA: hemolysin family protein [Pelovirga sp.]|nr:hemolysin family protein [Pelovirga sp.]
MDETTWRILALFFLLLLSGFFSGSETAFTSLDRLRLRLLQQKNHPGADKLAELVDNPDRTLSGVLVGNNLVNIASSVIAAGLFVGLFGEQGEWLTILILTPILLIFSEVCPKTLAAQYPERFSLIVLRPMRGFLFILAPVIRLVAGVSRLLTSFLRKHQAEGLYVSEDGIKALIEAGEESGVVAAEQRRMLHGIFELSETRVRDVMIPRTEVVGIDARASFEEVLEAVRQARHSRFPVYHENLDNIVGVLHSKNVLAYNQSPADFSIENACRKPYYVPESKRIGVLLQNFLKKREHLAIVVDEYGGMEGIVTLEDVVEEVVGDINDEYDIAEVEFRELALGHYLIDAAMPLREVNKRLGLELPEEQVTTLAGHIFQLSGNIPAEGDTFDEGGIRFRVRRMEERRIEEIEIFIMPPPEEPS